MEWPGWIISALSGLGGAWLGGRMGLRASTAGVAEQRRRARGDALARFVELLYMKLMLRHKDQSEYGDQIRENNAKLQGAIAGLMGEFGDPKVTDWLQEAYTQINSKKGKAAEWDAGAVARTLVRVNEGSLPVSGLRPFAFREREEDGLYYAYWVDSWGDSPKESAVRLDPNRVSESNEED